MSEQVAQPQYPLIGRFPAILAYNVGCHLTEKEITLAAFGTQRSMVSAVCLLFYTIIGWPALRLAYAAIPPPIVSVRRRCGADSKVVPPYLPR
jgi:hypothetical protein